MRIFVLIVAALALVGAAPVDHRRTVVATPEGGFRMGAAGAPTRLVEYVSLTCGHCATFQVAGADALKARYVASGQVSFEVRNMVLSAPDLAATLVARCDGPRAFFARSDALLKRQQEWMEPFIAIPPRRSAAISRLPEGQRLLATARAGRLDAFAAKLGVAPKRFAGCFANAKVNAVLKLREEADRRGVQGTPTFFINDRDAGTNVWAGIEPLLAAR